MHESKADGSPHRTVRGLFRHILDIHGEFHGCTLVLHPVRGAVRGRFDLHPLQGPVLEENDVRI